ncbi:2,3-bisphosphoglycerate-independent phosphoglycerate mutase [Deinococcus marmoris]|uniref:Probable 2,3-bisphosphoglycerate-independent phosphoglycerate mutase n=1 Tax=Deinococcus marmoris TaxID=249408 RepID=A0A1U7P547_9DEIO|nr:2,3-bisphosphoglycerate-independent phosphoglycerate mutase [Deinococcus marmoris]OLV20293.1 2,3-bisphosphoglycerate-independent phosphoglycerate mutase, archaeal type [Deinococcus marmoris]
MSDLLQTIRGLSKKTESKIVMVVLDGVGGLPLELNGETELATAKTPNLDALAAQSQLGQVELVGAGITPGSGPGHLSLFGYDPLDYVVGRGALSAVGIGVKLNKGDVAVRGNFATLGAGRIVEDRRAGRPSNEKNAEVVAQLKAAIPEIDGVPVEIYTESEHRFVVVFRAQNGEVLGANISDVDPQDTGVQPLRAEAHDDASGKTAGLVNAFVERAEAALKDDAQVNGVLFRGYSDVPHFPSFADVYQLDAACIASYPMYKGLASLVGMQVLDVPGEEDALDGKVQVLRDNWDKHDFFFFHVKKTDSTGEDGDFKAKVKKIELFDALLPDILALKPDVLCIVGDHSTPSKLSSHSWHPVPVLVRSDHGRKDLTARYTEEEAQKGSLGLRRGPDLMPILMANALKLNKYGA